MLQDAFLLFQAYSGIEAGNHSKGRNPPGNYEDGGTLPFLRDSLTLNVPQGNYVSLLECPSQWGSEQILSPRDETRHVLLLHQEGDHEETGNVLLHQEGDHVDKDHDCSTSAHHQVSWVPSRGGLLSHAARTSEGAEEQVEQLVGRMAEARAEEQAEEQA